MRAETLTHTGGSSRELALLLYDGGTPLP